MSTEKGRAHWQSTVMKPSSRVKLEALSSLSADRSVAKSLERSECAGWKSHSPSKREASSVTTDQYKAHICMTQCVVSGES